MRVGLRNIPITIQRGTVTVDDYGGETASFATLVTTYARVNYGTGQERRAAAQEQATQAATFECEWTPTIATVTLTDRIVCDGANWDIVSRAPKGLNKQIDFGAVRAE
jgi:head-tail adaptor